MASYLGFDFSTQQLKMVGVDENLCVVYENFIKFDSDLPHFGTNDGVLRDGLRFVSPTVMWVEALDMLFEKAKSDNFDFSTVKALSGAGQQHGSVYWKVGAEQVLSSLDPSRTLKEQLEDQFAVPNSPIWMDASTTEQCAKFVAAAGDEAALARMTGAIAFERFTGPQILRIAETLPEEFANTQRISLVSSFATSLFCGHYAGIDFSDGAGMNLMDIQTKQWCARLLALLGPDVEAKLGPTVPSGSIAGGICSYFVQRYGFSTDCKIVTFTGDNPASLAGMRLKDGDLCLSLGTSDVVIMWLDRCPELGVSSACVFGNPVDAEAYMAILCFKNGSLVRERMRAGRTWQEFNSALASTPKGNGGKIGIFFDEMEITPQNRRGTFRFGPDGAAATFSPEEEVRALLEGQLMAKVTHARSLGFSSKEGAKILVTGGASVNKEILQIIANVFNANVFNAETPNSAALGSAYRAKHALTGASNFQQTVGHLGSYALMACPEEDAPAIYGPLTARYKALEDGLRIA